MLERSARYNMNWAYGSSNSNLYEYSFGDGNINFLLDPKVTFWQMANRDTYNNLSLPNFFSTTEADKSKKKDKKELTEEEKKKAEEEKKAEKEAKTKYEQMHNLVDFLYNNKIKQQLKDNLEDDFKTSIDKNKTYVERLKAMEEIYNKIKKELDYNQLADALTDESYPFDLQGKAIGTNSTSKTIREIMGNTGYDAAIKGDYDVTKYHEGLVTKYKPTENIPNESLSLGVDKDNVLEIISKYQSTYGSLFDDLNNCNASDKKEQMTRFVNALTAKANEILAALDPKTYEELYKQIEDNKNNLNTNKENEDYFNKLYIALRKATIQIECDKLIDTYYLYKNDFENVKKAFSNKVIDDLNNEYKNSKYQIGNKEAFTASNNDENNNGNNENGENEDINPVTLNAAWENYNKSIKSVANDQLDKKPADELKSNAIAYIKTAYEKHEKIAEKIKEKFSTDENTDIDINDIENQINNIDTVNKLKSKMKEINEAVETVQNTIASGAEVKWKADSADVDNDYTITGTASNKQITIDFDAEVSNTLGEKIDESKLTYSLAEPNDHIRINEKTGKLIISGIITEPIDFTVNVKIGDTTENIQCKILSPFDGKNFEFPETQGSAINKYNIQRRNAAVPNRLIANILKDESSSSTRMILASLSGNDFASNIVTAINNAIGNVKTSLENVPGIDNKALNQAESNVKTKYNEYITEIMNESTFSDITSLKKEREENPKWYQWRARRRKHLCNNGINNTHNTQYGIGIIKDKCFFTKDHFCMYLDYSKVFKAFIDELSQIQ
ncbi:MAG: hypothetical protein MJ237_01225 [bacterium]|nr:hypothetical protein [bacterium]